MQTAKDNWILSRLFVKADDIRYIELRVWRGRAEKPIDDREISNGY